MKNALIMMAFFIMGIMGGLFSVVPNIFLHENLSLYMLYILLFIVGVGIGCDSRAWDIIKNIKMKIFLVPLSVIIGTYMGTALISIFVPGVKLQEALAIGSGFGYYSLTSILVTQLKGEKLGVIALLANMMREITTLILAPLMIRYFGKLSPISSGGATAMDTTLPIISKCAGKEYAMIAVFSGLVLTIIVPFLVTFILSV